VSESKAEIIKRTIGSGANYEELSCSVAETKGMLRMPAANTNHNTISDTRRWSNYHPDYGFPDSYRAEIISCATMLGIPTAAIAYNVSRSTIYRWLAHQATK